MFEHKSEGSGAKGRAMTILDTRDNQAAPMNKPVVRPGFRPVDARRRPRSARPGGAPMRHRGTGVLMSRASHRRRPITPVTTVLLAITAAAITVWLGLVAQVGGVTGGAATAPDRLAVVQVQAGETLQHVAARVAPDAPVGQVVERIRELNQLESVAVDAGQTLIAPIG
jgi:LysM domain